MKAIDIIFWIVILLIVGLGIWLLIGSPTETSAIIALTMFVATSELLLWRALFSIDKKTSIGFERIKNQLNNIENKLK